MIPVRDGWSVGGGADRLYYDMETPADATGILTADANDAPYD